MSNGGHIDCRPDTRALLPTSAPRVPRNLRRPYCSHAHCNTCRCPAKAAECTVSATHGQSCSRAHCNISRCPPSAAHVQTSSVHGQPCSRAHFNTSRCPPSAAKEHVQESHGQPCSRAHLTTFRCPLPAAYAHACRCHGHPCSRAHLSTSRCPPSARIRLVAANCHGQPFATAQTNVERDLKNAAMPTGGSTSLPPMRDKPERFTAERTALPARPSSARSTRSQRSSTSFWKRSGKSSTSASSGGRARTSALVPASPWAAGTGDGSVSGTLPCDAASSPAWNPASYPAPYPGDRCPGGPSLGDAKCPPPAPPLPPPSETAAALPPVPPSTTPLSPPSARSPPCRLLARVSMATARRQPARDRNDLKQPRLTCVKVQVLALGGFAPLSGNHVFQAVLVFFHFFSCTGEKVHGRALDWLGARVGLDLVGLPIDPFQLFSSIVVGRLPVVSADKTAKVELKRDRV